jgi:hypothetical protein
VREIIIKLYWILQVWDQLRSFLENILEYYSLVCELPLLVFHLVLSISSLVPFFLRAIFWLVNLIRLGKNKHRFCNLISLY